MANVLIIDDDLGLCNVLIEHFEQMKHRVTCAHTLKEGLDKALSNNVDVVFLDVRMPDGNGLELLPKIRRTPSSPEVIIITGASDPDGAELAITSGAWDYIVKPSPLKTISLPLVRALQYREEKQKIQQPMVLNRKGIVGNSRKIRACLDSVARAAVGDVTVLVTGETGTGKELFAQAIHANSSRATKNFVVVDCAALPETLVESVLFGYEKGAFTGADKSRNGLIIQADGGTLFLDEIGELPLVVQKSFLRVLQERRFRPIGSHCEIESDFRLVAATNQNLEVLVESGRFREDLLFRLRSFIIELPSLRERIEDISALTLFYIAKLCKRHDTGIKGISPDFLEALAVYHWPGNVRELIHTLERALAVAGGEPTLFPKHLPTHVRVSITRASVLKETAVHQGSPEMGSAVRNLSMLRDFRESAIAEVERQYLQELMAITKGEVKEACRISGLSQSRLYALLKKYDLSFSR